MPIPFLSTASFTGIQLTTNPVVGHVLVCVDADGTAAWSPVSAANFPSLSSDLDVNGNKIVSSNNGNIEFKPHGTGRILLTGPTVLGGNLDTNGFLITSNNNRNINISPHGTGKILLSALVELGGNIDLRAHKIITTGSNPIVLEPANNQNIVLNPSGTGKVVLDSDTVLGGNLDVATNKIVTTANNNNIELDPHGTGQIILNANVRLGGTLDTNNFDIVSGPDRNITLTPQGSGSINLNGPVVLGGNISATGRKIVATPTADIILTNGEISFEPNGSSMIRFRTHMSIRGGYHIVLSDVVGTRIGTASNQRLAFYGATPTPQPASAEQRALVDNTGGNTSALTLEPVGNTWSSSQAAIVNSNFARIAVLLNRLRQDLVSLGLIKGDA